MIRAMLRWLLILAMALLPWHGWAGASLPSAAPQATAAAPAGHAHAGGERAAGAHIHAAAGHAGDAGQVSADCAGQPDHAAAHASDGCPGCSMCHSCAPVGLAAELAIAAPRAHGRSRPAAGPALFASAERAGWLKPPIS